MRRRRQSGVITVILAPALCASLAGAQTPGTIPAPAPPPDNPDPPTFTDNLALLQQVFSASSTQLVPLIVLADSNGAQSRNQTEMGWLNYPNPGRVIQGGHLQGLMFALADLGMLGAGGSRGMGSANLATPEVMGGHAGGEDGQGADFGAYSFDTDLIETFSNSSDVGVAGAGVNGLSIGELADVTTNPAFGSWIPDVSPFSAAEIEAGDIYISLRGLGSGSNIDSADIGDFAPAFRAAAGTDVFCPGSMTVPQSAGNHVIRWSPSTTDQPLFDRPLYLNYIARWYRRDQPTVNGAGAVAMNAWGYIPRINGRAFATGFEASMAMQYGGRDLSDVLDVYLTKNQRQWNHYWSIHTASQEATGVALADQRAVVCVIFKGNDIAAATDKFARTYNGVGGGSIPSGLQTRSTPGYALNMQTLHSVLNDSWAASGRTPGKLVFVDYPYHLKNLDEVFNTKTLEMQEAVSAMAMTNTAVIYGMRVWRDGSSFQENDYYRVPADKGHGWNGNPRWLGGVRERAGFNWFHYTIWNSLRPFLQPLGDVNADGAVSFADISLVLANWSATYDRGFGPGDANADGAVDFADLVAVLRAWSAD